MVLERRLPLRTRGREEKEKRREQRR